MHAAFDTDERELLRMDCQREPVIKIPPRFRPRLFGWQVARAGEAPGVALPLVADNVLLAAAYEPNATPLSGVRLYCPHF